MGELFEVDSPLAIVELIGAYPLAWVLSTKSDQFMATPLPLLADTDPEGRLLRLVGHFARRNPHVAVLSKQPRVRILFMGPQGYISPSWQHNPQWAPTWNYAVLQIKADLHFRPDQNDTALKRLVKAMEAAHDGTWSIDDMGERYARLSQGVVAFHADVLDVQHCFKMGQDEDPQTRFQLLSKLGDAPLADYISRCNKPPWNTRGDK